MAREEAGITGAMARTALVLLMALLPAACSSPAATPTVAPTVGPSASPAAQPSPTAKPTPSVAGHWVSAGTMRLGRSGPHALPLGDGGALVVGNDTGDCLRDNSVVTEIWVEESWIEYDQLPQPRADFAAVALNDGRVLVTGGVERGTTPNLYRLVEFLPGDEPPDAGHRSFASTFIYEGGEQPGWSPAAPLGTPRTAPAAAVLQDGRVLVAGGYYLGAAAAGADRDGDGRDGPVVLAGYRSAPQPGPWTPEPGFDNDGPPPTLVPAMATAEIYDPATDSWSPTGPLHYARFGATAVTLADGRVLIVGSAVRGGMPAWNYSEVQVAEEVFRTAEIYDPATGRFSLTGDLPAADLSGLTTPGLTDPWAMPLAGGTLLALDDGDALLIGASYEWEAGQVAGTSVLMLRFEAATGTWAEVDRTVEVRWSDRSDVRGVIAAGHVTYRALAGRLDDGRILVAGGQHVAEPEDLVALDTAELYDPAAGTWTTLPPMPEHRAGGAAVTLGDGSVLLVGGSYETQRSWDCAEGATGLVTTFRFVPGP